MKGNMIAHQIQRLQRRIQYLVRSKKDDPVKAIENYRARLRGIQQKIERLPTAEKLATYHVMWNEMEELLGRFELLLSETKGAPVASRQVQRAGWN
jgi:hypothetical protein